MRRVAEAVGGSIDSAAGLPDFQRELLAHVRSMDAGIQTLVQDIADVKASLGPSATGQFEQLQESMARVEAWSRTSTTRSPTQTRRRRSRRPRRRHGHREPPNQRMRSPDEKRATAAKPS